MIETFEMGDLPIRSHDAVERFFDNLPEDKYADSGYRFRRFSKFLFNEYGDLVMDQDETFTQSSDINKAFGDVERKFEPIERGLLKTAGFAQMFQHFYNKTGIHSGIGCHMVRIAVGPDGVPAAPEGPHHDGFDYIGAVSYTHLTLPTNREV